MGTCDVDGCGKPVKVTDYDGRWCRGHADARDAERQAEDLRLTVKAGGPWPQTCPRRVGELGPWERGKGLDTWAIRDQMRTCSFCGSLHPADFMDLIEQGWVVGPTDKNYKVYLSGPAMRDQAKFYYQHLSGEQRARFVELSNNAALGIDPAMHIGDPGYFYVQPFFMRYEDA